MDNKLHFITTRKYGQVVVTNQSHPFVVRNEDGTIFDEWPAGLVLRWIKQGDYEPSIKFVEGTFTTDFSSDNEIRKYIDDNSILG